MSAMLDAQLQGGMHGFEDKVPIHRCPVDILELDSWIRRAIGPPDMPTDKTLYILCRRQLFHQGYFPPDVNDPLYNTTCCCIHGLLYCTT
jgi:hypothetical protein